MSDCKGCQIGRCFFETISCKHKIAMEFIERCPCQICLVKVMCRESCDLFDPLADELSKIIQEKRYGDPL